MALPILLTVEADFASAHFLPDYDGPCKNMHGHLWKIQVTFGPFVGRDKVGIAADFHVLKDTVRGLCEVLDHTLLNETVSRPTAENLVEWFHDKLTPPKNFDKLSKIELWESPTSSCIWINEDNGIDDDED